jgi:hypothetical protein
MTTSAGPEKPETKGGERAQESGILREWRWALLVSFLVALAIITPFFWMGNATGHDFQFHAASWLDAAGQWKQGVLYPRWTEWANYGYGEPRFIFYPPFSWMLGAALGLIGPWNSVPPVFIVLVQTFAGVSAFALAQRVLATRGAALFCAACYAANPYALLVVYWRSDFAEQLADAFYPLLFLFALQLCGLLDDGREGEKRAARRTMVWFALVFAAIWLSNAPAGVIASYSLVLAFAYAVRLRRRWEPLRSGAAAMALGFGLCAFYLLPAAYEQRWVNIAQALSSGLLPSQNFLYTETLDAEHTLFNWIASTLAVLMIVLAGLAAIAARRGNRSSEAARDRVLSETTATDNRGGQSDWRLTVETIWQSEMGSRRPERTEFMWRVLLLLAAAATFLMLRFSLIFWLLLPKLRFVQFPWRWMSLLAVPFAVFLGAAMGRRRGWIWAVVVFALLGGGAVSLVQSSWWDTDDIPVLRQAIADGQGFEGTDEYDPLSDDHTNITAVKSPEAQVMDTDTMQGPNKKPSVRVERWAPEEKEVTVSAAQPFYLGLRLLNYPAWRVELNGATVKPRGGEDFNMMIVQVPAGESQVRVRFARTWDRTAGGLISVAGILLVAWLLGGGAGMAKKS